MYLSQFIPAQTQLPLPPPLVGGKNPIGSVYKHLTKPILTLLLLMAVIAMLVLCTLYIQLMMKLWNIWVIQMMAVAVWVIGTVIKCIPVLGPLWSIILTTVTRLEMERLNRVRKTKGNCKNHLDF